MDKIAKKMCGALATELEWEADGLDLRRLRRLLARKGPVIIDRHLIELAKEQAKALVERNGICTNEGAYVLHFGKLHDPVKDKHDLTNRVTAALLEQRGK